MLPEYFYQNKDKANAGFISEFRTAVTQARTVK